MKVERWWKNGVLVRELRDGVEVFDDIGISAPTPLLIRRTSSTEWPLALRPLKLLAQPGDKGLGDIVERVIGPVGGEAYKKWYLKVFGKPCGCTRRKDNLNERFPLPSETLTNPVELK